MDKLLASVTSVFNLAFIAPSLMPKHLYSLKIAQIESTFAIGDAFNAAQQRAILPSFKIPYMQDNLKIAQVV
jgi:hypothetical protein